jgi:hypothetical protein
MFDRVRIFQLPKPSYIQHMQMQNIQDVVTQLTQIEQQCTLTKNKAGYFAALYKRMTVEVKDDIVAHKFEDGARTEKLDMLFAQRCLHAYAAFCSNNDCSISWQSTFSCCTNEQLIVLQHLLLGINTHINLDLAIAAATVAPKDNIYALQNDFYRINNIINSLLDDIQECLCKVWPPMRMLTKIANGRQDAVLNFSAEKARTTSWANAVLLANMTDEQKNNYIHQIDVSVNFLAGKIKSPGMAAGLFLRLIRTTEYDDVARTIKLIDTTVVN